MYINPAQEGLALMVRGKIGAPCGFGEAVFGQSQYGEVVKEAGIYQMRYPLESGVGSPYNKKKSKIQVRMRHYWPTNPNSPAQQTGRAKFKAGMQAWGALTDEEKAPWYAKEKKVRKRANALFMKAYMLDRELKP